MKSMDIPMLLRVCSEGSVPGLDLGSPDGAPHAFVANVIYKDYV
jgi:hypothetical protein